jgi:hypothetical protein
MPRKPRHLHWILDEEHNLIPVDLTTWALWLETNDRHVALTKTKLHDISTVFVGIDMGIFGGPPLVFETMVFNDSGEGGDERRYSSWDDAVTGHKVAVRQIEKLEEETEKSSATLLTGL